MNLTLKMRATILPAVVIAASCLSSSPTFAVAVITDGFGDADINNVNGAFEVVDTNINGSIEDTTYIPARLFVDGMSEEPENNEVTTVLDSSDTGIRWIQMRGFTGATTGNAGSGASKPSIRIVDDTQGAMLETSTGTGGLGIPAIDSGYAMAWESRGGGSSAAGFFDQTISLGPEVDDEVIVSFDYRLWRDAPNQNGSNVNNEPSFGELRFGLYQDTDSQLGMTNPFAGRQVDENGEPIATPQPAVWGQDEGLFEGSLTGSAGAGDDIGTNGDNGWQASVIMGDAIFDNGGLTRIREEVQSDRILQGSDVETIASPENLNPDPFGAPMFDFVNLDLAKVYNVALSLKRATVETPGDSITASLIITDKATNEVFTLSGTDDLADSDPALEGINSDSWDYFAIRNATSGAAEFDFIMDNFMVEVIGSNEPSLVLFGDADNDLAVSGSDLLAVTNNFGNTGPADGLLLGDADDDGAVSGSDLLAVTNNFGNTSPGAASLVGEANVPEPSSILLLSLCAVSCGYLLRSKD